MSTDSAREILLTLLQLQVVIFGGLMVLLAYVKKRYLELHKYRSGVLSSTVGWVAAVTCMALSFRILLALKTGITPEAANDAINGFIVMTLLTLAFTVSAFYFIHAEDEGK